VGSQTGLAGTDATGAVSGQEGQSRLAAHPELRHNPRRFAGPEAWDLALVQAVLAQGHWPRLVGKKGQITLYHRAYSVGRAYAGQTVYVRYDPATQEWVVADRRDQEIKRWAATALTRERILELEVSYVKPHRQRPAQEQNLVAYVVT
jgi:hypothetical protein